MCMNRYYSCTKMRGVKKTSCFRPDFEIRARLTGCFRPDFDICARLSCPPGRGDGAGTYRAHGVLGRPVFGPDEKKSCLVLGHWVFFYILLWCKDHRGVRP